LININSTIFPTRGIEHPISPDPRYCLVIHEKGRQRQKYVPNAQVPAAKDGIEQYHRLQEIVDEITQINLSCKNFANFSATLLVLLQVLAFETLLSFHIP
jgi:hypothetical protein